MQKLFPILVLLLAAGSTAQSAPRTGPQIGDPYFAVKVFSERGPAAYRALVSPWPTAPFPASPTARTFERPTLPTAVASTTIAYPNTTGYTEVTVSDTGNIATNGVNLQTQITNADCTTNGVIIKLVASITYQINLSGGNPNNLTLPAKTCAAGKWVILQTADLAGLPVAGTRVIPATHAASMGKIVFNETPYQGGIYVAPSSARYRIVGVEVTMTSTGTGNSTDLISMGDGSSSGTAQNSVAKVPSEIVVDRCYVHGVDGSYYPRRGVAVHCKECAVLDSHISSIANIGADSQAIGGWNGTGPVLIQNDYLSGAGEIIMFGGADSNLGTPNLPNNITIRGCYLTWPLSWDINDPSYDGVNRTLKNLLECKMCKFVLVEGIVFEHWWERAQSFPINFKSENQSGGNSWAETSHITFRRSLMLDMRNGPFAVGGAGSNTSVAPHHILFEDIIAFVWGNLAAASSRAMFFTSNRTTADHFADLAFIHNTVLPIPGKTTPGSYKVFYFEGGVSDANPPFSNVSGHSTVINDNVFGTGISSASVGKFNCYLNGDNTHSGDWRCTDSSFNGTSGDGADAWNNNLVYFATAGGAGCNTTYSGGNRYQSAETPWAIYRITNGCQPTIAGVGFTDYHAGDTSGDYSLTGASPGHNASSDASARTAAQLSTDVGADIARVELETCGTITGNWTCAGGKPSVPRGVPVPH